MPEDQDDAKDPQPHQQDPTVQSKDPLGAFRLPFDPRR